LVEGAINVQASLLNTTAHKISLKLTDDYSLNLRNWLKFTLLAQIYVTRLNLRNGHKFS